MSSKKTTKTPVSAARQAEAVQVAAEKVKGLSIDGVMEAAAGLQNTLTRKVGEITQAVRDKLSEAAALDVLITDKKAELGRLAGIDAELVGYDEKKAALEEQLAALEEQVETLRSQIAAEQAEAAAKKKTEDDNLKLFRKQEQDTYDYNKSKDRRAAEDAFNQALDARKRAEAIRQEDWERQLTLAQEQLKQQQAAQDIERITAELQTNFQAQLEAAVKEATTNLATAHKDELRTLKSANESVNTLLKAEVTARQAAEKENERLRIEVEGANRRLEAIALKAVDGASARESLANNTVQNAIAATAVAGKR